MIADISTPKVMAAKIYARPIVRLQFNISLFQSSYRCARKASILCRFGNESPDAPECAWPNSLIEICSEKTGDCVDLTETSAREPITAIHHTVNEFKEERGL